MRALIIIALLLISSRVYCQDKYDNIWVQGDLVAFQTTFTAQGPINTKLDTIKQLYISCGNSNICDSAGNLVLVSDGFNIYDKHLDYVQNGAAIVPGALIAKDRSSLYMQSSIFLPIGSDKYYFITPTASDDEVNNNWLNPNATSAVFDELFYSIVDMRVNNGAGSVTRRMVPLLSNVKLSKAQMMACRHADGKAWWLLKQASDTNMIYKFLFTKDSVYGPFVQGFPEPHFTKWDLSGQTAFSDDGTKYATTVQGAGKIFLADFDRCNGNLSNPRTYEVPVLKKHNPFDTTALDVSTNGLAFSPDGRFIYVNGFYNIQQIDLNAANPGSSWSVIAGLDTTWHYFNAYSNISPGPDGKLYVGNWSGISGQMSVINTPNGKATASGFCPRCLRFPEINISGTMLNTGVENPPCMPNYHLGKSSSFCWPASVEQAIPKDNFELYPNPTFGPLTIKYSRGGLLEIIDLLGRPLQTVQLPEAKDKVQISVDKFVPGVYFYRHIQNDRQYETGRLIVQ